jgi:cytochrome oxidase Cu insertion factor (SCO1/SenC/PrrC family)
MKLLAAAMALSLTAAAAEIPRKAPDVDITLPDGKKLNLDAYRGKVVCFAFILTT